ncbi:MAG: 23S rRNA (adenine(2503)-C(2))-methyltransferase RlmN [Clostridia bacterium]|nr:23S rRNA (adenine(2503)-C(2))-methyltransferase RlmN [Clostridia bacterium]MDY6185243.1 23S rRNA (adenine(2503)-C(2))-methyltransferase RlmN [Eubacteriales bacterium]
MIDLLSLLPEEIETLLAEAGEPRYRAKQIFDWCRRGVPFSEMSNLPVSLREYLTERCEWRLPTVEEKQVSRLDGTVKYLFRLLDGNCVESVLMHYAHGSTLCISSEVGCPMGCKFCASTIGGKVRNLLPSEMLGQIIAAAKDAGERIDGVVMMGIGEPLDNYENVIKFLKLVGHPDGVNIGYRHISLSTCGIVPRIYDLAEEDFPITLSVSLHAATDEARSQIMPINKVYPIQALLTACADYYAKTGRRISFEYTLIAGQNDRPEDADMLARTLRGALGKIPIHVNLIRVNEVKETGFRHGSRESADAFARRLSERGINATVRRRLGADIDAACGQLRKKHTEQEKREES